MSKMQQNGSADSRRGGDPEDEFYLKLVGERVRLQRVQRGMSRKLLSQHSGVSERYLAELERGTGNASLLVLRHVASALSIKVDDLAGEDPERGLDMTIAIQQLERLSTDEIVEARKLLSQRFGKKRSPATQGRIAIVGLNGTGKAAIAKAAADAMGIPLVDLDREIERASGMKINEVYSVHGEQVCRRLEHESLSAVINTVPRAVITTNGGIVSDEETYELLLSSCYVIWLKASPEQLVERAREQLSKRPEGLTIQARNELLKAIDARDPLYARADAVIETTGKSEQDTLGEFLGLVREERHSEPSRAKDKDRAVNGGPQANGAH